MCDNQEQISILNKLFAEVEQEHKMKFDTLTLRYASPHVLEVRLARPQKRNAINHQMWSDLYTCFSSFIPNEENCRVVVLTGAGPSFCAGIDLHDFGSSAAAEGSQGEADPARRFLRLRHKIQQAQRSFSAITQCPQPVIAAIHSACMGGGVDMVSSCDIRLCSEDATFCIKEVDVGLCADVGTLQIFPKLVGNDSLVREMAFTARKFDAKEAKEIGFVSRIVPGGRAGVVEEAFALANRLAQKSPVAIVGTKRHLNYSRDHTLANSLEYAATWNGAALQSEDIIKIATSDKPPAPLPIFAKL